MVMFTQWEQSASTVGVEKVEVDTIGGRINQILVNSIVLSFQSAHHSIQIEIRDKLNETTLNATIIGVVQTRGEGEQHFKPTARPRHEIVCDPRVDVCFVVVVEEISPQTHAVNGAIFVIPDASLENILVQHPTHSF
jgi:hypothetical protein